MRFPTAQTVNDWDDASLFSVCGYHAVLRENAEGFDSLNETERVLCCLFLFDNEVNNGGCGQWLCQCNPKVLAETAAACNKVGAETAALLVEEILRPLNSPRGFSNMKSWEAYMSAL